MRLPTASSALDLASGLTILRRVAPPHAPWPALLVARADGTRGLLVDASALDGWEGWRQAPGEHLVTPLDVVRTAEGHEVLLPAVVQRVDAFLRARAAHGAPVEAGEVVTLAGSVLRGIGTAEPALTGDWWLTSDGRPVFVPGDGPSVADGSRSLLDALSAHATDPLAGALGDLARTEARRLRRDTTAGEDRLLALAEPAALRGVAAPSDPGARAVPPPTGPPPRLGGSGRSGRGDDTADAPVRRRRTDSRPRRSDALGALHRTLRRALRPALRELAGRRRRAAAPEDESASRRRRPAPILVALGAGIVTVAGVAALWPSGEPAPAPGSVVSPSPWSPDAASTTEPRRSPEPSPVPPTIAGRPAAAASLSAAAADLLQRRRDCRGAAACLATVVEDPSRSVPAGLVDADAAERRIALLDDFGGVAVLRLDDPGGSRHPQLIVIVARNDGWLLRDVHDVAEQPS